MTNKIIATLLSVFLMTAIVGQTRDRDSAYLKQRERVRAERDSLKNIMAHLISGCTDFMPSKNPKWSNKNLAPKSYYQNCRWSGTAIVINSDSTFQYQHNGEGPGNYLEKGRWRIKSDSILVLRGYESLTLDFINEMKSFEDKSYKPDLSTRYFTMTQGRLIFKDIY